MKFSKMKDWKLIIVGDTKTPANLYKDIDCIYLTPEYQSKTYQRISDMLGWQTSGRRNIGFIEAYKLGAEIIALSDDDNIPYDNWGTNLLIGQEVEVDYIETDEEVFDPLSATEYPWLWHRGFPIQLIHGRNNKSAIKRKIKPLIQVDLWDGDPDVDSLERIIYKPNVKFKKFTPFCSNKISPFDSQNTFIHRDLIQYFMLLPDVGRVDDIWGSYLLQMTYKTLEPYIVYNNASVLQIRNEHDLLNDFKLETFSYHNGLNFIQGKYTTPKLEEIYKVYRSYFNEGMVK